MRPMIFLLALVSCSDETISGFADRGTVYQLAEINGKPFNGIATIAFPKPGVAQGQGPCNTWQAAQTVPYPWVRFETISSTKRACADMNQEVQFFEALSNASLAEIQGSNLILTDDQGREMLFMAQN